MGTRSHIYIETGNGYLGTYCQFDGYPDHMWEQVNKRSHEELYGIVLKGTTTCGMASLTDSGPHYHPMSGSVELLTNPDCPEENSYVDYVYIKRQDGSTMYRGYGQDDWATHDPDEID